MEEHSGGYDKGLDGFYSPIAVGAAIAATPAYAQYHPESENTPMMIALEFRNAMVKFAAGVGMSSAASVTLHPTVSAARAEMNAIADRAKLDKSATWSLHKIIDIIVNKDFGESTLADFALIPHVLGALGDWQPARQPIPLHLGTWGRGCRPRSRA
jgi:hypothetical protein